MGSHCKRSHLSLQKSNRREATNIHMNVIASTIARVTSGYKSRILIVVDTMRTGGTETLTARIANGFVERGHSCMILILPKYGSVEERTAAPSGEKPTAITLLDGNKIKLKTTRPEKVEVVLPIGELWKFLYEKILFLFPQASAESIHISAETIERPQQGAYSFSSKEELNDRK